MRAIAVCGLKRGDVTDVVVDRDRDRHFTVEVETKVRAGLIDEIRRKVAGADLELKSMRIKQLAGSVRFDVKLHQRFSPWPITEVNDVFLRAFRVIVSTRVDAPEGEADEREPMPLLEVIQFIRLRPASYIGTTVSALPLFERAFEPFIERAASGASTGIEVSLTGADQLTLSDDAPGVPLVTPEGADLELGRWFGGGGIVKALSSSYREESRNGELTQAVEYIHGRRVERARESMLARDGNRVIFSPDFDIIDATYDPKEIRAGIEWRAMLAPKSRVRFNGEELSFASLEPAVRRLAKTPLWGDRVFEFSFDDELVHVDCALGWRDGERELQWYVNRQRVGGDGALEHGLRAAVRNAISLGRPELEVEEPLDRLVGLVMARVPDRNAGNRGQYDDPAVDAVVERELTPALSVFLDSLDGAREKLLAPAPQEEQREREEPQPAERSAAGRRRRG
jgi:DNA gyrase/topoisomerase IV subunit B